MTLAGIFLFAVPCIASAQSTLHTPDKGSPERKAILDAVRTYRKAPSEVYTPTGFNVSGVWAYVAAPDPGDPDVDTAAFEVILKKTGSTWKVVDRISHVEGTSYKKETLRIRKRFPAMPSAILPTFQGD